MNFLGEWVLDSTKPNNLILRLVAYVRNRVPVYVWVFSAIVVLAVIVGTTGALKLKRSINGQSRAIPPATVAQPKVAPKEQPKPAANSAEPAAVQVKPEPVLPERDEAGANVEIKPYEEALPEKVFEAVPVTPEPVAVKATIEKPVEVAPEFENTWRKNAVQLAEMPPGPQIAIVIDDAGVDRKRTAAAVSLPGPITIAYLTYARALPKQVKAARAAGHEVIVHMAMEPLSKTVDPGPNVLLSSSDAQEILKRLTWGLDRFSGYVGINNHMGSQFTADPIAMNVVMRELKRRGLLFLDSRTSSKSVGASIALANDVPFTQRNIFLDNVPTVEAVNKQLRRMEIFAKRNGYAVAIGHPRDATLTALSQWLAIMAEKGFVLVPISTIVARQYAKN